MTFDFRHLLAYLCAALLALSPAFAWGAGASDAEKCDLLVAEAMAAETAVAALVEEAAVAEKAAIELVEEAAEAEVAEELVKKAEELMKEAAAAEKTAAVKKAAAKEHFQYAYPVCKAAAEQGDAGAQFELGNMYYEGKGVEKNLQEAYVWLWLAADGKSEKSKEAKKIAEVGLKLANKDIWLAVEEAKRRVAGSDASGIVINWKNIFTALATIVEVLLFILVLAGDAIASRFKIEWVRRLYRRVTSTTISQGIFQASTYTLFISFLAVTFHLGGWLPTIDDALQFVAVLIGPVLAVIVGIVLHSNWTKEERQHKVFNTLMTKRQDVLSLERMEALNAVDLEFKNQDVLDACQAYINYVKRHGEQGADAISKYNDLLAAIANKLGYKDKNPDNIGDLSYMPQSHFNLVMLDVYWKTSLLKVLMGEEPIATRASRRGGAEAQYIQALRLYAGDGVLKNAEKAEILLRSAAEKGYGEAKEALKDLPRSGEDVYGKSWFKKAVKQGLVQEGNIMDNIISGHSLGVIGSDASSTIPGSASKSKEERRGEEKAFNRYKKDADEGDADAQFSVALMYSKGEGVDEDKVEAAKWYEKAAIQGHAKAQNNLGVMYSKGEGVDEDKEKAVEWYRKAADQGDDDAQNNLGAMYFSGEGVPEDKAEAFRWFEKAAGQGHAVAQNNLGVMYRYGAGVPEDKAEALKWFKKAADQGYADAQFNLGAVYYSGEGVPEDKAEAFRWFEKAADQGHPQAWNNVRVMRSKGKGV